MAQILLRDIDDDVKERLQKRAARHGRSMEAEVRDILCDSVKDEKIASGDLGSEIAALFKGIGLREGECMSELRASVLGSYFGE